MDTILEANIMVNTEYMWYENMKPMILEMGMKQIFRSLETCYTDQWSMLILSWCGGKIWVSFGAMQMNRDETLWCLFSCKGSKFC